MKKMEPEIDALLRKYDANYDRPLSVDMSHPVMQEFYRTYVEPKLAALASMDALPANSAIEHDDPDRLSGDDTEEYIHPAIYQDAVVNGLNQLASKAVLANNERAAYLIELAAAEIKGFSEE